MGAYNTGRVAEDGRAVRAQRARRRHGRRGVVQVRRPPLRPFDVASDSYRLAEVVNHEGTHNLLCVVTPYGITQEALASVRPASMQPIDPKHAGLEALLLDASREVQEAAATFASLVLLPEQPRDEALQRLPDDYLAGYEVMRALLDHRTFDPLTSSRLARVVAARCLQTSILNEWHTANLHDPRELASYLSVPDNHPSHRFKALLDELSGWDDESVVRWAGSIRMVGGRPSIDPPTPADIAGIRFYSLPTRLTEAFVSVARSCRSDSQFDDHDIPLHLTLSTVQRLVLTPMTGGAFTAVDDEKEWLSAVDLVRIEANVFDTPMRQPGAEEIVVPPEAAQCSLLRCDYRAPLQKTVPIESVRDVLARVPAATIVLGSSSLAPRSPIGSPRFSEREKLDHFIERGPSSWLDGRPYCVWQPGDVVDLLEITGWLSIYLGLPVTSRWRYHANLIAENVGIIVARPDECDSGPLVYHTTLVHEWNNHLQMVSGAGFEFEPRAGQFFKDDSEIDDLSRITRVVAALEMLPQQWQDFMLANRRSIRENKLQAVNAPTTRYLP